MGIFVAPWQFITVSLCCLLFGHSYQPHPLSFCQSAALFSTPVNGYPATGLGFVINLTWLETTQKIPAGSYGIRTFEKSGKAQASHHELLWSINEF
jgi:hypothetical protein